MPAPLAHNAEQVLHYYIQGGMKPWIDALVEELRLSGGTLHCGCAVSRIVVSDNRAAGIMDAKGNRHEADVVVASGGATETFFKLVGEDLLPKDFSEKLRAIPLMGSIFMLHLGVDYDPSPYLSGGVVNGVIPAAYKVAKRVSNAENVQGNGL